MEALIFIGIQGCGKSSFFKERFVDTHVRINLDMLRTRHREAVLLEACLRAKQPFVVDNTSPTREDRQRYIAPAKAAGFRVAGYYFQSKVEDCKRRNEQRPDHKVVPLRGLLATYNKLELPTLDEGFDALHYVSMSPEGVFMIQEWSDEVR
jgi:predicted kinase